MFQNMCGSLSENFTFSLKYILCWQKNFKQSAIQTHKPNAWEAALRKNSMNTAATLSNNLWRLKWLKVLLFAVCNGFSVTFEHPTSNHYNIYVQCTSSAYFIIDDLLHFVISHGLHFVCTEILTCCKICTHKMATEKCFFSKWLCSILISHSTAFPIDNMGPWQKVTVITDTQQIHSTSCIILLPLHRDSSYILTCYWIKAFCVEKIWYDDYSSVKWWHYLT